MSTAPTHPNQSHSKARLATTLPRPLKKYHIHPRSWNPRHLSQLNIQVTELDPSDFLSKFLPPPLDTPHNIAELYVPLGRRARDIPEGRVADIQRNVAALPFKEDVYFQMVDHLVDPLDLTYRIWPTLIARWSGLTCRWKPWLVVGKRVVMLAGDKWRTNERIIGALFAFANGRRDIGRDVGKKDGDKDAVKEKFWAVALRDKWGIMATVEGCARDFRLGKPVEEGPMVVEISRWRLGSENDALKWVEYIGRVFELARGPRT